MSESYLGRIDSSLLKPYLSLRSDWVKFEKGFDDSETIADEVVSGGHGLKDRFARLSVMMKELEGVKVENLSMGMPTIPTSITGTFSRLGQSN